MGVPQRNRGPSSFTKPNNPISKGLKLVHYLHYSSDQAMFEHFPISLESYQWLFTAWDRSCSFLLLAIATPSLLLLLVNQPLLGLVVVKRFSSISGIFWPAKACYINTKVELSDQQSEWSMRWFVYNGGLHYCEYRHRDWIW